MDLLDDPSLRTHGGGCFRCAHAVAPTSASSLFVTKEESSGKVVKWKKPDVRCAEPSLSAYQKSKARKKMRGAKREDIFSEKLW